MKDIVRNAEIKTLHL